MGAPKRKERREPDFEADPGDNDGTKPASRRKRRGAARRFATIRTLAGRTLYWGAVAGLWMIIAAMGVLVWVGASLPSIHSLEIPKRPPSIKIVDGQGRALATRGDTGAATVTLKELPRHVPQAFIAVEDRRFYSHYGFDPVGIGRAMMANLLRRGVSQGGSTITQQLAKNLFLTQERTVTRKIQEAVLALWLEQKFTKPQILELYLNRVYFGAGAYGIEAAAVRYFNKPAKKLTIAEAAMLAGVVRAPSRLAPSRNPNAAEKRAQAVLAAMVELKFISDKTAAVALIQPALAEKFSASGSIDYAADWIMDVLNDLIGHVDQDIVVEASIDPALQSAAESALVEILAKHGARASVGQGAIVALSPDGAVRALVGGRNYAESQFNRAVSAKRQPGSAFKPFVYLTALERGLTPDTIREDKPISIKGWRPENYMHEYHGRVTLSKALAMSLNTVAVRLTMEVGPSAVVRTAHRLGIAAKLEPNASIALGTSEVSVLELVTAYTPFANGGMAVAPYVVQRVRTGGGKLLYERQPANLGRTIEPRMVAMMNSMMQETLLTGTARKAEVGGWPAAGKTGTSQDFRDAWFIGYTAHLVTGVWLGNDDNSPTKKVTGSGLPVDIWSRFMRTAHHGVPMAGLPGTSGGLVTGALSTPQTARSVTISDSEGGIDNWLIDRLFGRR